MSKPVISITIAYLFGLIAGSIFNYFPITVAAAIISFIIVEAILYEMGLGTARNAPAGNHLPFLFLIFLFGLFYYQLLSAPPAYNDVSRYIDKNKITIEGMIYKPPDEYKRKDVVYIKARKVYQQDKAKRATGRIRLSIFNQDIKPHYGDIIKFQANLKKPRGFWNPGAFDYEAYLAMRGIYSIATISEKDKIEIAGNAGNPFFRTIFDMRSKIKTAINNSLTGPSAGILKAMIIGDTTGLTDDIRDAFMASGTTHILSISGSHLGLIAAFIFFVVRFGIGLLPERLLLRITIYTTPTKIAAMTAIVPAIFYTLISGAQIATVRSMIMILVFILAILVDRGNEILNSLAFSCLLILLFEPLAIHDISFQLTMVSVLFIALTLEMSRWKTNDEAKKKGRFYFLKNTIAAYLLITLFVSIGTAPIVAYYFRQVAWVGLLANSIIVPFAGFVIVPLGLLSSVISVLTGTFFLSGLNEFLLNLFYSAVRLFAQTPYAELHIASPGLFYLSLFYILTFLLYRQRQINYKAIAFIGLMLFTFVARPLIAQLNRDFKATFLDVGQGDSAVIEFPNKKVMIIDGGGILSETFDIGRAVLAPFLWDKGIYTIDYLVLTHPQLDHVGGFPYLEQKFKVKEAWENGEEGRSIAYKRFAELLAEKAVRKKAQIKDMIIENNDVRVSAFKPNPSKNSSANDRSIVLKISHKSYSFLFSGDIEKNTQDLMLKEADLKSNIIKVPHHGAKSSLNEDFISAVSPEIAVVSVGYMNRYRHPSSEHIETYEKIGAKIFRTDKDGAIIMNIGDKDINIKTFREITLKRINMSEGLLNILKKEAKNIQKLVFKGKSS